MKDLYKYTILFIILFLMWLTLSGMFSAFFIVLGLIVSIVSALFCFKLEKLSGNYLKFSLQFIINFPVYLVWLVKEIILSSVSVTSKIWDFSESNISPEMEWIPHNQKSDIAITVLSNSITITPGTLVVDIKEGYVRVHFLSKGDIEDFKKGVFDKKISFLCGDGEKS